MRQNAVGSLTILRGEKWVGKRISVKKNYYSDRTWTFSLFSTHSLLLLFPLHITQISKERSEERPENVPTFWEHSNVLKNVPRKFLAKVCYIYAIYIYIYIYPLSLSFSPSFSFPFFQSRQLSWTYNDRSMLSWTLLSLSHGINTRFTSTMPRWRTLFIWIATRSQIVSFSSTKKRYYVHKKYYVLDS